MNLLSLVTVPYVWHATVLEALWLVGGLVALPLAIRNLRDARRDEEILDDVRNDPAVHSRHYFMIEHAAKGATIDHWLTVISAVLICVAGIGGCVIANPLGGRTSLTVFIVTAALLGISGSTALRAWHGQIVRGRLYELAAGRSSVLAAEMRAKESRELTSKMEEEE